MLLGRGQDQQLVDALLDRAREGRSAALVIGGDPGIGKTTMLAYAEERATGMTVLRGTGIETEAEIPFASLHLLLRPALGHVDALPGPQAAALRSAFGMGPATRDDQLLVGLAVLSLLSELADDGPLLCLVDDAHWLDLASAGALRFAAHRLHAEGVAMLFGARDGFEASGLPEHRLQGLDRDSAVRLLAAVYFAPDQIEAAARTGRPATDALHRFETWALASGLDWARAVLHRCHALLEPDWDKADDHFRAAVRLHAGSGRPWEAARTRLAYGERLRRERHKGSARPHLRAALETFERLSAAPWAERARTELRASGDTSSATASTQVLTALSPQELQIVRLAAAGLTNREIGAQLFLSPKTVSYHLYRAFPKLNVASRAQLAGLDLT